jgi:hypothetical protein
MITNFERETSPLSEEELLIADMLIRSLSKVTKSKPVTTNVIIDKFNNSGIREHLNISCKLTDIRLRKIINHIRSSGMLPILSKLGCPSILSLKSKMQIECPNPDNNVNVSLAFCRLEP